ncbi:MAG: type II toxin-antitoxin system VapC family toxin [Pyrinomonadaceae bacterium]
MIAYVLDASAILALLFSEPGRDRVEEILEDSTVSRINVTEVLTKLIERGASLSEAKENFDDLRIPVTEFDFLQSEKCAELRMRTKHLGLSLGDRACLALAMLEGATAVTADKAWENLPVCKIEAIR